MDQATWPQSESSVFLMAAINLNPFSVWEFEFSKLTEHRLNETDLEIDAFLMPWNGCTVLRTLATLCVDWHLQTSRVDILWFWCADTAQSFGFAKALWCKIIIQTQIAGAWDQLWKWETLCAGWFSTALGNSFWLVVGRRWTWCIMSVRKCWNFLELEGKNLVFTHHSIVHCLSVTVVLKLYIKSTWRSLCKQGSSLRVLELIGQRTDKEF